MNKENRDKSKYSEHLSPAVKILIDFAEERGLLKESAQTKTIERRKTEAKWAVFYDPHSEKTGEKTSDFAQKLGEALNVNPWPCQPTPLLRGYELANIDIVILNEENNKVRVLCEIEESTATPKVIVGDVANVLLSDSIRIEGKPYEFENPHLLVVLLKPGSDVSRDRADALAQEIRNRVKPVKGWNFEVITEGDTSMLISKIKDILEHGTPR